MNSMRSYLVLFLVLMMTVSGCGTAKKAVSLKELAGEWSVVSLQGKEQSVAEESRPYIGFDINELRMYGMSGCNRMMSAVNVDAKLGTITFGPVAGTRMACPDMSLEQAMFVALDGVRTYTLDKEGALVLYGADGHELMVLRRR